MLPLSFQKMFALVCGAGRRTDDLMAQNDESKCTNGNSETHRAMYRNKGQGAREKIEGGGGGPRPEEKKYNAKAGPSSQNERKLKIERGLET